MAERIYVGGVDGTQLTIGKLVQRLQDDLSESLLFNGFEYATSGTPHYCHLTATSRVPAVSALDILSRKYNNVTWKGCRLKVEAAKVHFLERLRRERIIHHSPEQPARCRDTKPHLPRYVRIRNKQGYVIGVDTRPIRVSSQEGYQGAIRNGNRVKERKGIHLVHDQASPFLSDHIDRQVLDDDSDQRFQWSDSEATTGSVASAPNKSAFDSAERNDHTLEADVSSNLKLVRGLFSNVDDDQPATTEEHKIDAEYNTITRYDPTFDKEAASHENENVSDKSESVAVRDVAGRMGQVCNDEELKPMFVMNKSPDFSFQFCVPHVLDKGLENATISEEKHAGYPSAVATKQSQVPAKSVWKRRKCTSVNEDAVIARRKWFLSRQPKADWECLRSTLTQDWKRKRKRPA